MTVEQHDRVIQQLEASGPMPNECGVATRRPGAERVRLDELQAALVDRLRAEARARHNTAGHTKSRYSSTSPVWSSASTNVMLQVVTMSPPVPLECRTGETRGW